MRGIDLNKPITFLHSSLRFFSKGEHHVTRFCENDVLIMVYDGVLRFTEDGQSYEIHPGEYHIQKSHTFQDSQKASDSPKYLYVHFCSEWGDNESTLSFKGVFDYSKAKTLMEEMDRLSHTNSLLAERSAKFLELLMFLQQKDIQESKADRIAEYILGEDLNEISLERICNEFHFSKNHVINIFKKEFGVTPVKYINHLKLRRAKYLLEATSDTLECISHKSGFNDYSHFYKLFCRENGVSPAVWRNKKHTEPLLR